MNRRIISLILALILSISMFPVFAQTAEAADTNSVEIYFSISHDANYVQANNGTVMALEKMTVPYFDLGNYGLERFYFVSEHYEKGDDVEEDENGQIQKPSSNLQPGTEEHARGKVTMLHAFIYATEVYQYNVDPKDAGQGFLKQYIGSSAFNPTGSTGSLFITGFWGMDLNFNYYHNYQYPLASEGWGSTADQILLHDGDIVTLGHFSSYDFHKDSKSVFNLIKAGNKTGVVDVAKGDSVDLTVYVAGAGGNYTTAHTPRTEKLEVYYIPMEELDSGVVSSWYLVDEADANGNITFDTSDLAPGKYLVGVKGQKGAEHPNVIVSTPGGIILNVTEDPVLPGDVNGSGSVDVRDLVRLAQYVANPTAVDIVEVNSDVTDDGNVDVRDLVRVSKYIANPNGIELG